MALQRVKETAQQSYSASETASASYFFGGCAFRLSEVVLLAEPFFEGPQDGNFLERSGVLFSNALRSRLCGKDNSESATARHFAQRIAHALR